MAARNNSARGPSRRHLDEARRLIRSCTKNTDDPGATAEALNTLCGRVIDHLEPLIGRRPAEALLARAVHLSKPRFNILAAVSTTEIDAANVARELTESLRAGPSGDVSEALETVLGNFVWLLTYFISEDLGLRLLREACPDPGKERQ